MSKLPTPPRARRALPGRPTPLRPDPSALADVGVRSLSRAALSQALSECNVPSAKFPLQYVKRTWPADRDAILLTRGISAPLTTSDAVALQTVAVAFLSALTSQSAGADLLGRSLQLVFGNRSSIYAP